MLKFGNIRIGWVWFGMAFVQQRYERVRIKDAKQGRKL